MTVIQLKTLSHIVPLPFPGLLPGSTLFSLFLASFLLLALSSGLPISFPSSLPLVFFLPSFYLWLLRYGFSEMQFSPSLIIDGRASYIRAGQITSWSCQAKEARKRAIHRRLLRRVVGPDHLLLCRYASLLPLPVCLSSDFNLFSSVCSRDIWRIGGSRTCGICWSNVQTHEAHGRCLLLPVVVALYGALLLHKKSLSRIV